MPPPNTPEEFFEEEYRQRRNTAVANAASAATGNRRRRFSLSPHDEALAEGASDVEQPNLDASHTQDRRPGGDRRHSMDRNTSRSSSRSPSPLSPLRRRSAAVPSSSPSPVDPIQSDSDAGYEHYYSHFSHFSSHRRDSRESRDSQEQQDTAFPPASSPQRHAGVQSNPAHAANENDSHSPLPSTLVMSQLQGDAQRQGDASAESSPEAGVVATIAGPAVSPLPRQSSFVLPPLPGPFTDGTTRKRAHTPKLDWHALEYIGTYDENLDCPICRSPLVKPEITTCFHIFCHKCLVQTLEHGNRCPIDRNPIQYFETSQGRVPARPAPPIIANQLDNLQVRCPNARCDYVCARSIVKQHYKKDCPFTKIPCPDESCLKLVARRDSEDGSCLHKAVACVYCGKPVELASLDDHYDTDCNQKELMCEHCLAAVPRHRHGTHVANCSERRMTCKYRTSGCTYAEKRKDFGDHERTCLYGMFMRMNRAHRADMNGMETVLQDSQERVRKLELELASRLPPAPTAAAQGPPAAVLADAQQQQQPHQQQQPQQQQQQQQQQPHYNRPPQPQITSPNMNETARPVPTPLPTARAPFFYNAPNHPFDGFYGAGAFNPDVGGADTRPTSPQAGGPATAAVSRPTGTAVPPSGDEGDRMNRIVAYIDIFDAKVENLERYLGEVDARQAQLFMNELGPLKDQILELRNSMGHISMYVRWLMESFRQTTKRSVGLGGAAPGGAGAGAGAAAGTSTASGGASASSDDDGVSVRRSAAPSATARMGPPPMARGPPPRRMSDRENPPRL